MTAAELNEHARYLADQIKMRAYRQAIRHAMADGRKTVLDLGSGTGILGLLAAEEGAERVYAVDSGPIIGPAADVAESSAIGDAIVHLHASSMDVELPEQVDIAICDQIGGFVHDAGILQHFADARRRHLAPDGLLIPGNFRLFLAPASCTKLRDQIKLWDSHPEGFDFSTFRDLAVNSEHRVDAEDCQLLSHGVLVAEFAADHDEAIVGSGSALIDRGGLCDGLVGWFEADLGGGASLTNHPTDSGRMQRWCNFYPIARAQHVEPGGQVDFEVDVRPQLPAVTWTVAIEQPAGTHGASERHSTLLGEFLSPEDLGRP